MSDLGLGHVKTRDLREVGLGASLACAVAQSLPALLIFRLVQGIAAASAAMTSAICARFKNTSDAIYFCSKCHEPSQSAGGGFCFRQLIRLANVIEG
jgi:hypothetical protein